MGEIVQQMSGRADVLVSSARVLLQTSDGKPSEKLSVNFFSSSFCPQLREPPSRLPLITSSRSRLPLRAPGPKAAEVIGGQIRCLYNNGNSIRKWRGVGRYCVSHRGLYFPESSWLAGGEIRRRSSTQTRSAGWEEDREVPRPP